MTATRRQFLASAAALVVAPSLLPPVDPITITTAAQGTSCNLAAKTPDEIVAEIKALIESIQADGPCPCGCMYEAPVLAFPTGVKAPWPGIVNGPEPRGPTRGYLWFV